MRTGSAAVLCVLLVAGCGAPQDDEGKQVERAEAYLQAVDAEDWEKACGRFTREMRNAVGDLPGNGTTCEEAEQSVHMSLDGSFPPAWQDR